jgi:type II secretory pathway pseudopilin PulG
MNLKKRKSFLMIELLTVMIILSMLFSLGLSQRTNYYKDLSKTLTKNIQNENTLIKDIDISISEYGEPSLISETKISFSESLLCNIDYIYNEDTNSLEKTISNNCDIETRPIYIDNIDNLSFEDNDNNIFTLKIKKIDSNLILTHRFHSPNYDLN